MTEQEFMKHVWRPYDTVEVIGDITGAVLNVCFPVKSVKISLPGGAAQWFKCRDIVRHISRTDTPDDMSIIEDLHNKLMAANKRNDDQQKIIDDCFDAFYKRLKKEFDINPKKTVVIRCKDLLDEFKRADEAKKYEVKRKKQKLCHTKLTHKKRTTFRTQSRTPIVSIACCITSSKQMEKRKTLSSMQNARALLSAKDYVAWIYPLHQARYFAQSIAKAANTIRENDN